MSRRKLSTPEARTLLGSAVLAIVFVGSGFVAGGDDPTTTTTDTTGAATTDPTAPTDAAAATSPTDTVGTFEPEDRNLGFALVDGVEWEIVSSCRAFDGYGDQPLDVHTLRRDGELLVVEDDRLFGSVNVSVPGTFVYLVGAREGGESTASADVSDGDTTRRIELDTTDSVINGIQEGELGTCQSASVDYGDAVPARYVITSICAIGTSDDGSSAERLSLQGARSIELTYGAGELEGQSDTDAHSGQFAGEVVGGSFVDTNFSYEVSAPGAYTLGGEGEYGVRDVVDVGMVDGEGFEITVGFRTEWTYNWLDEPSFGLTPYREAC